MFSLLAGFPWHYSVRVKRYTVSLLPGKSSSPVPVSFSWYLSWKDAFYCWEGMRSPLQSLWRWPHYCWQWWKSLLFTSVLWHHCIGEEETPHYCHVGGRSPGSPLGLHQHSRGVRKALLPAVGMKVLFGLLWYHHGRALGCRLQPHKCGNLCFPLKSLLVGLGIGHSPLCGTWLE